MIPKELTNRINIYNMSTRQEIKNRLLLSLGNKVFNECKVNSDIDWMFEAYDIIPKSAHASMEIRPSLSFQHVYGFVYRMEDRAVILIQVISDLCCGIAWRNCFPCYVCKYLSRPDYVLLSGFALKVRFGEFVVG